MQCYQISHFAGMCYAYVFSSIHSVSEQLSCIFLHLADLSQAATITLTHKKVQEKTPCNESVGNLKNLTLFVKVTLKKF